MLILACLLVFLSVTLLIGAFGTQVTLAPRRGALKRLQDLQPTTYEETLTTLGATPIVKKPTLFERLFPWTKKKDAETDLTVVGLKPDSDIGRLLLHAGYRSASAIRSFQFSRIVCAVLWGGLSIILVSQGLVGAQRLPLLFGVLALMGFMMPKMYLRLRARRRQHRLRLSLPDALDLLVVCVEAGMGLNQAVVRVSEELRDTHPEIADEFRVVNLEIRAGKTRHEALRGMGDRTGVHDIVSLASMIIQTDRFGTSIARSLRVHSDSLRTERRQRAEEAAAKTTIKLVFPLVFCIFPALFIIILGPAGLHLYHIFGQINQ